MFRIRRSYHSLLLTYSNGRSPINQKIGHGLSPTPVRQKLENCQLTHLFVWGYIPSALPLPVM
ncbi:hypothetical protein NIES39_D04220 [Arthrospira platensis NIES-39]|nr:hypothetical protein NIES39_D04220 [Arthrospira platensis NIES-39]